MAVFWRLFGRAAPFLIGMPGVSERDAVPDHPGTAEQTGALDSVFTEAVANGVHGDLQLLAASLRRVGKKSHLLARIHVAQPGESDAQSPDPPAAFTSAHERQRGSVDLLAGGDRTRKLGLL